MPCLGAAAFQTQKLPPLDCTLPQWKIAINIPPLLANEIFVSLGKVTLAFIANRLQNTSFGYKLPYP